MTRRKKRNERQGRAVKVPVTNPRTRGGHQDGAVRICGDCGKRCFTSKGAAKKNAKTTTLDGMRPYRCGEYWHLGHLPGDVIRGIVTRGEIYD